MTCPLHPSCLLSKGHQGSCVGRSGSYGIGLGTGSTPGQPKLVRLAPLGQAGSPNALHTNSPSSDRSYRVAPDARTRSAESDPANAGSQEGQLESGKVGQGEVLGEGLASPPGACRENLKARQASGPPAGPGQRARDNDPLTVSMRPRGEVAPRDHRILPNDLGWYSLASDPRLLPPIREVVELRDLDGDFFGYRTEDGQLHQYRGDRVACVIAWRHLEAR